MREIKLLTEENRLHLVISGYTPEDQARLLEVLAEFSREAGNPAVEENIEDFEDVNVQDVEINATNEATPAPETTEASEHKLYRNAYQNFWKSLCEKNELFVYHIYKDDAAVLNSFPPIEKKAFGAAFSVWFLQRYKKNPFAGDDAKMKKQRRGFFNLYRRYLANEISSLETQYGLEKGTFSKTASDAQIDEAYELCRQELLKRCAKN